MDSLLELAHVAKLKCGNRESFRFLYDRYFDRVYRFCLSLIVRPEDAEEVTTDVFVTIWRRRKNLHEDCSIKPLLFKISRDLAWNHLRKIANQRSRRTEFVAGALGKNRTSRSQYYDDEMQQTLEQAIGDLPPQQEKIFRMRFLEGLDLNQIADELAISKNTVKVHLAKSKNSVKGILQGL